MKRIIEHAISNGELPNGYELQASDIGRPITALDGFGPVQRGDVGKRVFVRDGILQMENNEQRDKRKNG